MVVWRCVENRIAKRVYVGECASSCSEGRPRKRWIDTVKDCLRKRVTPEGSTQRYYIAGESEEEKK